MGRREQYRVELRALDRSRWPALLGERSGLPGPRGNIELAQAVADEGDPAAFDAFVDTGDEYLVFCGVLGLGRLLADDAATGRAGSATAGLVARLHGHASDERWRVREAVAMALQRLGDADVSRLFEVAAAWAADADPLVQRAAVAAVCEPRLLATPDAAARALELCARVTDALAARPAGQRRADEVRALRKGLGYCWSVAVAADPGPGLPRFRALAEVDDPDVAWIVRENSRKNRLARLLQA